MLVQEKMNTFFTVKLSLRECYVSAYANDAKIVRSRDAQCNTEESP